MKTKNLMTVFPPLAVAILLLFAFSVSSYYPGRNENKGDLPELFIFLPYPQESVSDDSHGMEEKVSEQDLVTVASIFAKLNPDAVFDRVSRQAREKFILNLFPDIHVTAVLEEFIVADTGKVAWRGSIEEDPEGWITFVFNDGGFSGNVVYKSELYQIRKSSSEGCKISHIDQSLLSDESQAIEITVDRFQKPDRAKFFAPFSSLTRAADDGSEIDVLVVYSDDARDAAGGDAQIQSEIDLAITETNTTFTNSGITLALNLVGTLLVNYSESGDLETDLNCITDPDDACLDGVHDTRDQVRADLVSFWVENGGGNCSIAWQMSDLSLDFAPFAFSVVDRYCATSNFSFAEALGHNLAARNDWYTDSTDNSPYTDNHGYVYSDRKWRTVMGKNSLCQETGINCNRIPYWSNPNVDYMGVPTGIVDGTTDGMGNNIAADNSLTLERFKTTAANFRTRQSTLRVIVNATGSESGTVTSMDGNIDCATDCSQDYDAGTEVILSAAADTAMGYFSGWDGAGINCPGTGDCTVTLDGDLTVNANFIGPFTLTVMKSNLFGGDGTITSNPGSIDCGGTCSESFSAQSQIVLTATGTQNPSSRFTGWSGSGINCPGEGDCTVTMTADTTVTGEFIRQYSLGASKIGQGSGTVTSNSPGIDCGDTCTYMFDAGQSVELSAAPTDSNSTFQGWMTGPCSGTGDCTVSMNMDITQEARFNLIPPVADFAASHQSGNAPLQVIFTDLSTNAMTYQWDFDGDGSPPFNTEQNPGHLFTIPGSYLVKLTVSNDSGSDTKTITQAIEVTGFCPTPSVRLAADPNEPFEVITNAYGRVTADDTIQIQALRFSEDIFLFNRNINSLLVGGYDCNYAPDPIGFTTLEAFDLTDVTMEVQNGELTIDNILLNGQFLSTGGLAIIQEMTIF